MHSAFEWHTAAFHRRCEAFLHHRYKITYAERARLNGGSSHSLNKKKWINSIEHFAFQFSMLANGKLPSKRESITQPSTLPSDALRVAKALARKAGIEGSNLAFRWHSYHLPLRYSSYRFNCFCCKHQSICWRNTRFYDRRRLSSWSCTVICSSLASSPLARDYLGPLVDLSDLRHGESWILEETKAMKSLLVMLTYLKMVVFNE